MTAPACGLVLVDKPSGPSSFAVVRGLRARFGVRAGHAGTLDPLASGLILVLLGPATRLARYLVGLDKRYETAIELGRRTSTGDAEGEEIDRTDPPVDLQAELERLRGEIELPIPAASAVKVDGERAYRLHRRGVAVEMPLRRSIVYDIGARELQPARVELALHVSSGTYVRSIADALGGHCLSIRRTAVGSFRVEDADEQRVISSRETLPFLAESPLDETEVRAVRFGRPVEREGDGLVRLVRGRELVAVARLEGGLAHPETVLPA